MREVKYTTRFQREKSGRHSKKLDALLMEAVNLLAADTPLPRRNFDHPLSGEWSDHRDCHLSRISFSSTASRMTTASNSCALARIARLACEHGGGKFLRPIFKRKDESALWWKSERAVVNENRGSGGRSRKFSIRRSGGRVRGSRRSASATAPRRSGAPRDAGACDSAERNRA